MTAAETFNNPDFPIEVRLKAAIACLEMAQARVATLERKKTPPERAEFEALQKELAQERRRVEFERQNSAVWKDVSHSLGNQITELKNGTMVPRLERERDMWQSRWRSAVARIGVMLEHQGCVELLEDQLNSLERQNAALRFASDGGQAGSR